MSLGLSTSKNVFFLVFVGLVFVMSPLNSMAEGEGGWWDRPAEESETITDVVREAEAKSAPDASEPSDLESLRERALKAQQRAQTTGTIALSVGMSLLPTCFPPASNVYLCRTSGAALLIGGASLAYAKSSFLNDVIEATEYKAADTPEHDGQPYCADFARCDDRGGRPDPKQKKLEELRLAEQKLKEGQEQLKKAGYKVDEKGLTLPDGTHIPASSLSSSALASMGADPELLNRIKHDVEGEIARQDAEEKTSSLAAMSAGGGGFVPTPSGDRGPASWAPSERAPASVDGLSKRHGNDLIGVAASDIFNMVSRRYQEERKRTDFLE